MQKHYQNDLRFYYYLQVSCPGGLLAPAGVIRPVVNVPELT